jgi:hypothetical protein
MKMTVKQLNDLNACIDGVEWFNLQKNKEVKHLLRLAVGEGRFRWANWYVSKVFTRTQAVLYAIFSAESCLEVYENEFPNDTRPRDAIKVAKKCVINPTEKNKLSAYAAANAAAYAAYAAANAAYAAANAAYAAAYAAYAAANAAYAAANAVYAAYAAGAAGNAAERKIIEKAIKILGL